MLPRQYINHGEKPLLTWHAVTSELLKTFHGNYQHASVYLLELHMQSLMITPE